MSICTLSLSGGEALGTKYDEVWVARLKHPEGSSGKHFVPENPTDFARSVESAAKVRDIYHKRIDTLFRKDGDFDNGSADIRLQLYSLVFYRRGKIVLIISPNILGGDLYASDKVDKFDPRSLSAEQMNEFLSLAHLTMALSIGEGGHNLPYVNIVD